MRADLKALADIVIRTVKATLMPLAQRIDDFDSRLKSLQTVAPEAVEGMVAKAVDAIPKPRDGQDVSLEAVKQLVQEAVAGIPAPKDGTSVTPDDVAPLISDEVAKAVAQIPKPKDGQDVPVEDVQRMVSDAVAALPVPKDGTSVSVDDLAPLVQTAVSRAVAEIPVPQDGKDVDPDQIAEMVKTAVDALPKPRDGTSVSAADVEPLVAEQVAKAVAAIPAPKDGESVPLEQVERMVGEAVAKAMALVRPPKDGDPGRDAVHIEILPAIDAEKSYPRGTYAKHAGGLWRSFETTAAMKGWECIVDGVADLSVEHHDARSFEVVVTRSSGDVARKAIELPAMIYRGVFREGEEYAQGDTVTWGGSLWHCNAATTDKPADGSKSWQLCAKKGRDGKDTSGGSK